MEQIRIEGKYGARCVVEHDKDGKQTLTVTIPIDDDSVMIVSVRLSSPTDMLGTLLSVEKSPRATKTDSTGTKTLKPKKKKHEASKLDEPDHIFLLNKFRDMSFAGVLACGSIPMKDLNDRVRGNRFPTVKSLENALVKLADMGYIKIRYQKRMSKDGKRLGGRPSKIVEFLTV